MWRHSYHFSQGIAAGINLICTVCLLILLLNNYAWMFLTFNHRQTVNVTLLHMCAMMMFFIQHVKLDDNCSSRYEGITCLSCINYYTNYFYAIIIRDCEQIASEGRPTGGSGCTTFPVRQQCCFCFLTIGLYCSFSSIPTMEFVIFILPA